MVAEYQDGPEGQGAGLEEAASVDEPGIITSHPQHLQAISTAPTTTATTTAAAAVSVVHIDPGVTLVSPHPAPDSIGTGSSPSRQYHILTPTSKPTARPRRRHSSTATSRDGLVETNPYQPLPRPPQVLTPQLDTRVSPAGRIPSATKDNHSDHHRHHHHKMIFTDLYKSPRSPLSRLRHAHHPALALGPADYDADLFSKDKARQKSAVKKHLQAKVRNDWVFTWPLETPRPDGPEPVPANNELEGYLEVASVDSASNPAGALDVEDTALDSGEEGDSDSEAESVYSIVSDDPLHWTPRLEWTSELSEDELPYNSPSPFKFDSPDSITQAVAASKLARKARRRKELRKETAWNDGLACFEARRNAWTGAKTARVRPKPASPASASSLKRGLFWRTHSHSSNAGQTAVSPTLTSPLTPTNSQPDAAPLAADGENPSPNEELSPKTSHSSSQKQPDSLPVETLLPVPPPLLPPANPMRASIQPQLYHSIYEKVVVHSLQPSCPINLSDMIRACVAGWKRDGEWPPRSSVPEPAAVVAVRRKKSARSASGTPTVPSAAPTGRKLSFSFLSGRGGHDAGDKIDKDRARRESNAAADSGSGGSGTGKALRKGLQKVLGLGHSPTMVSVGDGGAIAVNGQGGA